MILFINTASTDNRVSVLDDNMRVVTEKSWTSGRDQAEIVLPAVRELVAEFAGGFSKLTRIIAVTGPGPFTSVRIGIAIANALAYALGIPARGVRLDVLEAHGSLDNVPENLFSEGSFVTPYYEKPPHITPPNR